MTEGPAGFEAYARLRFAADPDESDQWRRLSAALAAGTSGTDDCFFGLWDGWPSDRTWCGAKDVEPTGR